MSGSYQGRTTGRMIVKALQGSWHSNYGTCRCPAHDDTSPSLSVRDTPGHILVKCFAGCDNRDVVAALRGLGLWPQRDEHGYSARRSTKLSLRSMREARPEERLADVRSLPNPDELARREAAREIWRAAQPIANTPASLYLWSRGINVAHLPPSLRAAPILYHRESKTAYPALIAALQDSRGQVTAVHRIWVTDKLITIGGASPKKGSQAPVKGVKKTLGPMGDGAIRLGRPGRTLGLAEGLETGLSAQQIYRLPVWVACGTARLDHLWLPDLVERVILFRDNGAAGIAAADRAVSHYDAQGYTVEVEAPPDAYGDFNDLLMATILDRAA